MRKRLFGLFAALALSAPMVTAGVAVAQQPQGQQPKTLRAVMHSDLKILDPIWTTAFIVRNHGYMVYDTLFALDSNLKIQPQMVDSWKTSDDKLTWTFTLRDGLEFHDGQPVTSEDVIASLKRWAARDSLGQILWAKVAEAKALDPKTFQLVLKAPTGVVLQALAKPSGNPFIMPKRVAETDPSKQIDDTIGSGPFIFKKEEWKPGDKTVYVKNRKYKPRAEPASGLAGGKIAKVDRVEWVAMPDQQTAVNALLKGEIDIGKLFRGLSALKQAPQPPAPDSLADRLASNIAELPCPATILLATGDRTAQAFMDALAPSLAAIEANPSTVGIEKLASPSHSFAGKDADWLLARILKALA